MIMKFILFDFVQIFALFLGGIFFYGSLWILMNYSWRWEIEIQIWDELGSLMLRKPKDFTFIWTNLRKATKSSKTRLLQPSLKTSLIRQKNPPNTMNNLTYHPFNWIFASYHQNLHNHPHHSSLFAIIPFFHRHHYIPCMQHIYLLFPNMSLNLNLKSLRKCNRSFNSNFHMLNNFFFPSSFRWVRVKVYCTIIFYINVSSHVTSLSEKKKWETIVIWVKEKSQFPWDYPHVFLMMYALVFQCKTKIKCWDFCDEWRNWLKDENKN